MEITIGKKAYELHFGIGFIRELDRIAGFKAHDINMGMGLTRTLPSLEQGGAEALADAIYSATAGLTTRPTMQEVEAYLEAPDTDLEKVLKEVTQATEESKVVQLAAKKLKAASKAAK
jgi:hypothetical protein